MNRPADKPVAIDDRIAYLDAIAAAYIHQHGTHERTSGIGDDPARGIVHRLFVNRIQQSAHVAEPAIHLPGTPLPLAQALIFLLEAVKLFMKSEIGVADFPAASCINGWQRCPLQDRRRPVGNLPPRVADDVIVEAAEDQ